MKRFLLLFSEKNNDFNNSHLSNENITKSGELLKEKRESFGLSKSELASKTRISVAVIDAIENGWLKLLPEKTYLWKMLLTLENELGLEKGTLNIFLDEKGLNKKQSNVKIFTPTSINLFSSWQGTIVYIFLIAISLLLINRQQRYLSIEGVNTTQPHLPKDLIEKIYDVNKLNKNKKTTDHSQDIEINLEDKIISDNIKTLP